MEFYLGSAFRHRQTFNHNYINKYSIVSYVTTESEILIKNSFQLIEFCKFYNFYFSLTKLSQPKSNSSSYIVSFCIFLVFITYKISFVCRKGVIYVRHLIAGASDARIAARSICR